MPASAGVYQWQPILIQGVLLVRSCCVAIFAIEELGGAFLVAASSPLLSTCGLLDWSWTSTNTGL
jgi:hypothetical protein